MVVMVVIIVMIEGPLIDKPNLANYQSHFIEEIDV